MIEVIKTDIDGVVIIQPKVFGDSRGYFMESYSMRDFNEQVAQISFENAYYRKDIGKKALAAKGAE